MYSWQEMHKQIEKRVWAEMRLCELMNSCLSEHSDSYEYIAEYADGTSIKYCENCNYFYVTECDGCNEDKVEE